jgi:ABC-2 type transport system permease protein
MKQTKLKNLSAIRYGGYSVIVTAVVLAVVILLNLGINLLPASMTKLATDGQGLYDISDVSRSLMEKVEDKITIYIVGYEDDIDLMIQEYAERYAGLSSKVTVKTVDPTLQPGFVSTYTDETLDASATNLIVVNEANKRSRVIHYSEIFYQKYTEQELYYYYLQTGTYPDNPTYFNIENELASAIDYVTLETLPTIYYTTGHEELKPDEGLIYYADASNIVMKELALSSADRVPADASALMIYCPAKDFTEAEIKLLQDYAEKGGTVILSSAYESKREDRVLENLYGFAKTYGLSYQDALICEGSASHHPTNYPHQIYPQLCIEYASLISSGKVIMANCHAITVDAPAGVTVKELMTTSVKGYAKAKMDKDSTFDKEEGDVEGKYVLGALAEKKEGNLTSRLYWFASDTVLDIVNTVQYFANPYLSLHLLSEVCEIEDTVSIAAKALQVEALSVSEGSASLWGILLIGFVPVATLIVGFVVWQRRVKR